MMNMKKLALTPFPFKIKKTTACIALSALFMAAGAVAAPAVSGNQGSGTVTFKGEINDSPCSITAGTKDQTVNMGSVSAVALLAHKLTKQPFEIDLENCTFGNPAVKNKLTVTFTGAAMGADNEVLNFTSGTARGAGIRLVDTDNSAIKLGTATKPVTLSEGSNQLHFSAFVDTPAGATAASVIPGDFAAVTNFKLAYN